MKTLIAPSLATEHGVIALPNGHSVNPNGRPIPCDGNAHAKHDCTNPVAWCEYMRWKSPSRGIAFYYYCEECWILPGPHGDTPKERANKVQT